MADTPVIGTHLAVLNLFREPNHVAITVAGHSYPLSEEFHKQELFNRPIDYIDKLILDAAMRRIFQIMFKMWALHEASWDENAEMNWSGERYTRQKEDCAIEAAGGDYITGCVIALLDYWGNDLQSMSPHYGIALGRDAEGKLVILEDIPPAPSPKHWWSSEESIWKEPSSDEDGDVMKVEEA